MKRSRWEEFAAEQAAISWRVWWLCVVLTYVGVAALFVALDWFGGPALWSLLPSLGGPLLALVLMRLVAIRKSR